MYLKDLSYPLRLCVEMMLYAAWIGNETKGMMPSEARHALSAFFDDALIDEATNILTGRIPNKK